MTGGTHSLGGTTGGLASGGRSDAGGTPNQGGTSGGESMQPGGGFPSASGGLPAGGHDTGGSAGDSSGTSAGGTPEAGGEAGAGGSPGPDLRPCDIYASGNSPCVAAYSTVRALLVGYSGPLYQVRRADGATLDIEVLAPGSVANAAQQDAFCGAQACTVSMLYDQSGEGNHLTKAPPGCFESQDSANESDAKGRSLTVAGHDVYALYTIAADGYRNNSTHGVPTGDEAQGIYAVVDGKRYGEGCCWDFGNATRDNCPGGTGSANALFFGTAYWGTGAGEGPWFMGDFQPGVWSGGSGASRTQNSELPSSNGNFAFGTLKTSTNSYAIRVGDARAGGLTTAYDGPAPAAWQLEGSIVLGIGIDTNSSSFATFFEGAVTNGRPSDAIDEAVLKNVQAAGYGR